jgi:hypothetical protein
MRHACSPPPSQIGQAFKPDEPDTAYDRASYMLTTLGLAKYSDNIKKQLLTDQVRVHGTCMHACAQCAHCV